jgi:GTPase SAR1 family protein
MLGDFGVGKTSLVSRFVESIFSEAYRTSIGVSVTKKVVAIGQGDLTLVLWDMASDDVSQRTKMSYLRGMSGYLLVADGTRPSSLEYACHIYERIYNSEEPPPDKPNPKVPYIQFPYRQIPFIFLLNKSDLVNQWRFDDSDLQKLRGRGWPVVKSSAKEGEGVEETFLSLGRKVSVSKKW